MRLSSQSSRRIVVVVSIFGLAALCCIGMMVMAAQGRIGGSWLLIMMSIIGFTIGGVGIAVGALVGIVCAIGRWRSPLAKALLTFGLMTLALSIGGCGSAVVVMGLEDEAIEDAGVRAQPTIEAIRAFERDNGRAPGRLEDLVPVWIAELPSVYGNLPVRYDSAEERGDLPVTWSLRIPCSRGVANWDQYIYYPDGNYTGVGRRWGGDFHVRGEWAYIYE